MTDLNSLDFPKAARLFLTSYLPNQRGYSHNTVLSYRDSLKLLLKFIVDEKGMDLKKFTFKDFTKDLVVEFLENYRSGGASPSAANQRLGAIKSFAGYASAESIESMQELVAIQNIKMRKTVGRTIQFLTPEQTAGLINKPDTRSRAGLRHRTILTLLYDSGCRVQELCDLTLGDINVAGQDAIVTLHGKGGKTRPVCVSDQTAAILKTYIDKFRKRALRTDPFIVNQSGRKMDRDGVTYVVQKYASLAAKEDMAFPRKVHCHMLRHSKAMHMLQAGINIVYIRDFLGHENITTTMVYARADNRTKTEVIGKLAPKLIEDNPMPDWTKDRDLMDFLNDLK